MTGEYQIRVLPQVAANEQNLKAWLADEYGFDVRTCTAVRILKRSIDARQRTIFVNLKVRVYINEQPADDAYQHVEYGDVSDRPQVIVVGAGPGGLFAALRLIELGLRPVVLERGKNVHDRKRDLAEISRTQQVDAESNYCFGEGGAGAYSDGKLYTRSKKRGNIDKILNVFCQHGASTAILADAHPHIGTDRLPKVIENMRNTIIRCGGEVHFQTKMTGLILDDDRVVGCMADKEYRGPVILATGHSARDVYRYLAEAKIEIEAKGIAVGVRLEHPSQLIDQIQYHSRQGRGKYLPAAEYSFVTQVDGRGVYSFCMCPGGFVIPAATDREQIVVNGMSPANRGTAWSNSGMVVETRPEDVEGDDVLRVMRFQEQLERMCWQQGNMKQTAPSQRMADFVNNIPADKVIGLVTGSDGYFYGRDYSSTDPDLQGQMYMKKHWYNYMLLARLMYENDMSRERIFDIFSAHYNNMAGTDILYEATSVAGKIIPQVHQIYFQDNGDYTWFVSGSWSHPNTFGYLDIKRWMKSNNPFKDGNAMSIEEYALRISNKDDSEYTTQTPQEISDILAGYGNDVLAKVGQIRSDVQSSENMSFAEKEFWALVSDDEAMAYLGLYYSEKIMGAVELRIFNDTKDETWKESSVNHLQKAAEYFTNYAGIISDNYVPQHLARVGHFDINEILESVRKDVQVAENWKPKRITPSWNPPSKSEYFGGSSNG